MNARKHAELRGLSPGGSGCGAAPPPPPLAKLSVSPSSETGERSADEVLRFIERGDDAWWKCGFREGEERVTW
jgi:hypothetical protein